jgi:hypothetical protein
LPAWIPVDQLGGKGRFANPRISSNQKSWFRSERDPIRHLLEQPLSSNEILSFLLQLRRKTEHCQLRRGWTLCLSGSLGGAVGRRGGGGWVVDLAVELYGWRAVVILRHTLVQREALKDSSRGLFFRFVIEIAIWNSLPGVTPVKKFKDRTTAATRIWNRIQDLGEATKPKAAEPVQPKAARKAKGGTQSGKGAPTKGKATKRPPPPRTRPRAKGPPRRRKPPRRAKVARLPRW